MIEILIAVAAYAMACWFMSDSWPMILKMCGLKGDKNDH